MVETRMPAEDIGESNAAGAGFALDTSGGAHFDGPRHGCGYMTTPLAESTMMRPPPVVAVTRPQPWRCDAAGERLGAHRAAHFGGVDVAT